MAYSAEVMRRARQRLANAKADRVSENQEHLRIAYARVPRLKEIDTMLSSSMALAARAAFTDGTDARLALEQVRLANLALQQEREALAAEFFEEGYLDDSPICQYCGGNGYVGSTMCECLRELCRQEQRKELTYLRVGQESFDKFRLDYYPDRIDPNFGRSMRSVMERTFKTCQDYANTFGENSGNLLFSGDTGLGKTFLSACIAKTVAGNGFSVVYESAPHLFSKLEKARFTSDEQAQQEAEKFSACDLLIIDDLGTELQGNFVTAALYMLINDRILTGKPTIISTNLSNEDLAVRYSPQIVSRLRGAYKRLAFVGEDIRLQKNRGL